MTIKTSETIEREQLSDWVKIVGIHFVKTEDGLTKCVWLDDKGEVHEEIYREDNMGFLRPAST